MNEKSDQLDASRIYGSNALNISLDRRVGHTHLTTPTGEPFSDMA